MSRPMSGVRAHCARSKSEWSNRALSSRTSDHRLSRRRQSEKAARSSLHSAKENVIQHAAVKGHVHQRALHDLQPCHAAAPKARALDRRVLQPGVAPFAFVKRAVHKADALEIVVAEPQRSKAQPRTSSVLPERPSISPSAKRMPSRSPSPSSAAAAACASEAPCVSCGGREGPISRHSSFMTHSSRSPPIIRALHPATQERRHSKILRCHPGPRVL